MEVEITRNDIEKLKKKMPRALERAHDYMALDLEGNLKEYAPKDTGYMASRWNLKKKKRFLSVVGNPLVYALVQSEGSDPYMIYPRVAKALRFKIDGQWIFAKEVLHPGINPTYYIDGAVSATRQRISDFVSRALDEEGLT